MKCFERHILGLFLLNSLTSVFESENGSHPYKIMFVKRGLEKGNFLTQTSGEFS